ncbi:RHS repeat-associated core domain-containing protein, partial [Leptospira selangorensis]
NEFGQTAGFGLGNGVQTNYTYDVKQRLVRINSTGDVDGTTKTLQDAVYAFNSRNNITGIANTSSEYTTVYNYSYDGLNRLVAADGQYQESADNYTKTFRQSFAYAKNGNLTAKRNHNFNDNTLIDEWNYQYSNHQVTHIDSTQSGNNRLVMSYDSSGNMTYQRDNFKDLTKTISVDSQNRITQVQDALNTTISNYSYDEGGFRVRKRTLVPNGASFKNQEILYPSKFYGLEYSEETNVLSSINNVYLNGVRIAALNEDGVTAYFLTDQVDSVAHVLDEGAHTLSRMQYEPYGETLVKRGTLDFAPKYNSQELDRETNFYFYNARYYDPQIARFTSADTLIDGARSTQGWNRFSYVAGNPIGSKDPTGHESLGPMPGTAAWRHLGPMLRGITKDEQINAIRAEDDLTTQSGKLSAISKMTPPGHVTDLFLQSYADVLEKDYKKLGTRLAVEGAVLGAGYAIPYASSAVAKKITTKLIASNLIKAPTVGSRVFWSGGKDAMKAAADYAKVTGGKTLEMTFGGRVMTALNPILPRSISKPIWEKLSSNFAKGAKGSVEVFQNTNGVRTGSIWAQKEYKILKENNVNINYHEVTPK